MDAHAVTDATADATTCASAALYVAPDGTGTACSCAAPCALTTARDRARELAPSLDQDLIILLGGGTYSLTASFTLDATDSGVGGHAIVYRAAPGEQPLLSGGTRITGWTEVPGDPGLWTASVTPGTSARQLYVNDRRAVRARGLPGSAGGYTKTATGFALGDATIASWPDRGDLEVVGTREWKMFRCPVADVSAGGLVLAEPCWTNSQRQANYTFDTVSWLENTRELCDEAGEFYLDSSAGTLYYRPRPDEDLATATVVLPAVEELIRGAASVDDPLHDVAFEGLVFAHAAWNAPSSASGYASLQASYFWGSDNNLDRPLATVTFDGVRRVRISGCQFRQLGGAGLILAHAQDTLVETSRFEDVAASAVLIGDVRSEDDHHPSSSALVVSDNTVRGCYVTRAGRDYLDAPGILVGYTTRTTIEQNELFDLPYTAVSVGWGWGGVDPGGGSYDTPTQSRENAIRNNLISHHMRALHDGGAIYTLGAQPESVIEGNVISNQGSRWGNIYLDNGTQGYTVHHNVVLLDPKADLGGSDPYRSYWLYVQVYAQVAKNNVVGVNYTNDPSPYAPQPIDPSNTIADPVVLGADLSSVAEILAAAGSPLRDPEIAKGRAATATSIYDSGHPAAQGNDGNAYNGWSPAAPDSDPQPSWQVDLGAPAMISAVEVVSRWAIDQPVTRRDYQVLCSDDAAFTSPTTLGTITSAGMPHRSIAAFEVDPPQRARYLRIAKTTSDYFFLGEVRIHGVFE